MSRPTILATQARVRRAGALGDAREAAAWVLGERCAIVSLGQLGAQVRTLVNSIDRVIRQALKNREEDLALRQMEAQVSALGDLAVHLIGEAIEDLHKEERSQVEMLGQSLKEFTEAGGGDAADLVTSCLPDPSAFLRRAEGTVAELEASKGGAR